MILFIVVVGGTLSALSSFMEVGGNIVMVNFAIENA